MVFLQWDGLEQVRAAVRAPLARREGGRGGRIEKKKEEGGER
jgi:hypothetical protein